MELRGLHHLVLLVDDVPSGEDHYRALFDLDVLFREGAQDGDPGTVPDEVSWKEARAAGVTPYMSFLGRDDCFLAVAPADGQTGTGRVDHIALAVDEGAFEAVAERAEGMGYAVAENAPHHRTFTDDYGVEWELNAKARPPGRAFDPLEI